MIAKDLMKTDYARIDKSTTVSKLVGELIRKKCRAAVVFDKKKYVGITSRKTLIRTKLDPAQLKVLHLVEKVPTLSGKEDIAEIAHLMYTADAFILPVIEKKIVVGIVDIIDVVNQLKGMPESGKRIKDIMTLEPIVVNEDSGLGDAITVMQNKKVSRIPIVDKKGRLVNVTSIADILEQFYLKLQHRAEQGTRASSRATKTGSVDIGAKERDFNLYPIINLTSTISITGQENETVSDVLDKMNEFDISSLVIVRNKEPIGIVTVRDLLKLFMKDKITY
jgi:CBS domain-containing protein